MNNTYEITPEECRAVDALLEGDEIPVAVLAELPPLRLAKFVAILANTLRETGAYE